MKKIFSKVNHKEITKVLISFFAIWYLISIHQDFAQTQNLNSGYDASPFVNMKNLTCVNLQNDMSSGAKDYYLYGNVMKLQMYLYQNDLLEYPPTGTYSQFTVDGVKTFQTLMGLMPTGEVDLYTRIALARASCGNLNLSISKNSLIDNTNFSITGQGGYLNNGGVNNNTVIPATINTNNNDGQNQSNIITPLSNPNNLYSNFNQNGTQAPITPNGTVWYFSQPK